MHTAAALQPPEDNPFVTLSAAYPPALARPAIYQCLSQCQRISIFEKGLRGRIRIASTYSSVGVCSAAAGNIDTLVRNQGNVRARSSAMMGLTMY